MRSQQLATLYVQDAASEETETSPQATPSAGLVSGSKVIIGRVPILMYHYIEHVKDPRDITRKKLDILPETLDSQLQTLTQAGYTFMYASEVGRVIDGKESLPPKPIVLTFDDGYQDFYTDALPILEKYHVKATAYIITGFLGKKNYMTQDQLLAVKQSGLIEIGAHTVHHIDLNRASPMLAQTEIVQSQIALQNMFGEPIVSFAYPSGRFNLQTVQIVKNAGFTTAVSTNPGTAVSQSDRFVLFRLRPGSRTGKTLLEFLARMVR